MTETPDDGTLAGVVRSDYAALVEDRIIPVLDSGQGFGSRRIVDGTVRPVVLEYRVIEHIVEHLGETAVCEIAVRAGRRLGWNSLAKFNENGDLVVWG